MKRKFYNYYISLIMLLLIAVIGGCGKKSDFSPASAAKADYMVAIDSPLLSYLPFYVAMEDGSFAERGLNLGILWDKDGKRGINYELLTGDAAFALVDPSVWLAVADGNAKTKPVLLGRLTGRPHAFIYGKDKNKTPLSGIDALRNGRIYVNSNDLASYGALLYSLDVNGIDREAGLAVKAYDDNDLATQAFMSADNSDTNCFLLTPSAQANNTAEKLNLSVISSAFAGGFILSSKPPEGAFEKKAQTFLDVLQHASVKCGSASSAELTKIAKKYVTDYTDDELTGIIEEYQKSNIWAQNISLDKDNYYATLFMLEGAGAGVENIAPYEKAVNIKLARQSSLK